MYVRVCMPLLHVASAHTRTWETQLANIALAASSSFAVSTVIREPTTRLMARVGAEAITALLQRGWTQITVTGRVLITET